MVEALVRLRRFRSERRFESVDVVCHIVEVNCHSGILIEKLGALHSDLRKLLLCFLVLFVVDDRNLVNAALLLWFIDLRCDYFI